MAQPKFVRSAVVSQRFREGNEGTARSRASQWLPADQTRLSFRTIVKRIGEYVAGASMFSNKRLDV